MEWVNSLNPQQKALADKVVRAAEKYGVDPAFALSTAKAENDDFMHSVKRKSGKGAIGLMQIMPNTAKELKIDPYNVDQNIDGGVRYLKENLDRFGGDKMLASVAYNYGPNSNFFKTGYLPDETRGYIQRITKHGGYGDVPVGTMPTPPMQKISTGAQAMAEKTPSHGIKMAPIDEGDLKLWSPPSDTTDEQVASRNMGIKDLIAGGTGAATGLGVGHMLRPPTEREERNIRGDVRNELTANQQRIQLAQAQAQADALALGQPVQTQTGAPTKDRGFALKNWNYSQYPSHIGEVVEAMNPNTEPHAGKLANFFDQANQTVKAIQPGALPMQASPFSTFSSSLPSPPVVQTPNLGVAPTRANLANLAPPRQLTPAQLQMQVIANRAKNIGSGKSGGALMGAIAGQQGYDAQQRFAQGDTGRGMASALTAAGAALTMAPSPRYKALGAATTAVGGGLQLLKNIFDTEDQTKSVLQPDGAPPKLKEGGAIKKSDGGLPAVEHFQSGGRAGAGKAAWQLGSQQVGKLSDWAQNYLGHYFVPTQSDRMAGVGGTSFSANSLARPEYANRAWGSGQKATATGIANLAKDPRYGGTERQIFAPLIGSENMHQSNQIVYDELLKQHNKNLHKYSPERVAEINQYMQTGGLNTGIAKQKFDPIPEFNVLDQDLLRKYGDTFDTRKAIANHAFGAEGLGKTKKRIFDYQNILDEMRDPLTEGSPSFSMGPRAFKLSGEVEQIPRADLNEAYPWMLHGKDLDVTYRPVPSELSLRDFQKQWRQDTGNTLPKKSGALKQPGYYEHTAGYTPEGASERVYPRQLISEDWIKDLQSGGFAEGGLTGVQHYDKGGKIGGLTRLAESAYDILKLTPEKVEAWRKANAKPYKQQQDPQLAQALEAYMTGKISQADYLRIMNERRPIRPLTEVPAAHSDTDIASALLPNQVEKKGILGVNLFAPQGMRVGNRLDIPAYERYGTYVDTMHDPAGKPIAYGHTGHLKNVEFQSDPNRAIRVGLGTKEQGMTPLALEEGQGKAPFAMMVGDNQVTSNDEVRRMLAEALKDPSWTQVGMNPYRGSQFYDKADMQPVFSAAEKIQAGPLVLARDVEKTSWKDPRLKTKYGVNYAKGGLTHL
jgi:hypothetical protein